MATNKNHSQIGNNFTREIKTKSQVADEQNLKGFNFGLKLTSGRFYFFAISLVLVVFVYAILYYLQFFTNTFDKRGSNILTSSYKNRIERNLEINAPRGDIVDKFGNVLATSVPYQTFGIDVKVFLDPKYAWANNPDSKVFKALAKALNLTPERLQQIIWKNPNSRYQRLGSKISPTLADYIKELKIPGITSYTEYRRFYPMGDATAQLVGLLGADDQGQFGVEKLVNDQVQSTKGKIKYDKDPKGNIINYHEITAPQKGETIRLTIDSDLQYITYQAVQQAVIDNKSDSAMAVLIDVKTGKILAMAGAESFNPNDRSSIDPSKTSNLVISRAYEPGSTVKPFVVYAGLKNNVIKPNTLINTSPFSISRHKITDVAPRGYQTVREVLQNSSNIGVSTIALRLRGDEIYNTYLGAGFGEPTDLGLTGELKGKFFKYRPSNLDRAVNSYGYGLQQTPLQIAHAYATLGNLGKKMPLSIIESDTPAQGEQTLDPKVVKTVLDLMQGVAEHNKYVQIPNYNLSIKTGTAKRVVGGVYTDQYTSLTAGVAPSTDPKFALVVIIDTPKSGKYYGGAIAAPVWKEIMYSALKQYNIIEDRVMADRLIIQVNDDQATAPTSTATSKNKTK